MKNQPTRRVRRIQPKEERLCHHLECMSVATHAALYLEGEPLLPRYCVKTVCRDHAIAYLAPELFDLALSIANSTADIRVNYWNALKLVRKI